jgi:hypothetical protein
MPRTGGGGMVMMKASWMVPRRAWQIGQDGVGAPAALGARRAKGASAEKMAPAFEALVKVAPSSPAKGTTWATPGVFEDDLGGAAHHRVGARQRGAGRQLDHGDQIALVLLRDEAGGRAAELPGGEADQPGIDDQRQQRDRAAMRPVQRGIAAGEPVEAPC